jgi:uroporphyrinogen decarboxylase
MTIEEYEEFGRPYDLRVLDAARHAEIMLLHIHGERIMFEQLIDYPVHVVNWHDRRTPPSLKEARAQYSGTIAGGVDSMETIGGSSAEKVTAEVKDAIAQTEGKRLIVTAGCVIPIDAPEANIRAVRGAVEP